MMSWRIVFAIFASSSVVMAFCSSERNAGVITTERTENTETALRSPCSVVNYGGAGGSQRQPVRHFHQKHVVRRRVRNRAEVAADAEVAERLDVRPILVPRHVERRTGTK